MSNYNIWNPMAQAQPESFMNPAATFNSGQAGMGSQGQYNSYPFGAITPYYNPDPYMGLFSKFLDPYKDMRERYKNNPNQDTRNTVANIPQFAPPVNTAPAPAPAQEVKHYAGTDMFGSPVWQDQKQYERAVDFSGGGGARSRLRGTFNES